MCLISDGMVLCRKHTRSREIEYLGVQGGWKIRGAGETPVRM